MTASYPVGVRLQEADGEGENRRWTVHLDDGAAVEAVLYRGDSLCVSSQVGCAVGCPFCASGANGLTRPLTLEEMVGQVDAVRALGHAVTRVTVSGVGEPLHTRATLPFLEHCRQQRIKPSLTTSGGPLERLREAIHAPHNGLTVSVHAGTEPARSRAVPRGPALGPLFEVLEEELPKLSRSRLRKIALAYLILDRVNDGDDELDAFARRARPLGVWTHLYAYNPVPTSAHRGVSRERYERAYERLGAAGLRVRMSCKARVEPNGGCGTLIASARLVDRDRSRVQ
ncbi:MAG: radical SAM protein [Sandaracinaceae bacterium]|nr:radical SAM protein [Sandaracinaceae bacterium]